VGAGVRAPAGQLPPGSLNQLTYGQFPVDSLLDKLKSDFALKDLGALSYFLRIEVNKATTGIYLTQTKYTSDLLKRAGMLACKPVPTPLATSSTLSTQGEGGGGVLNSEDAT
jgi:hypothetical protein